MAWQHIHVWSPIVALAVAAPALGGSDVPAPYVRPVPIVKILGVLIQLPQERPDGAQVVTRVAVPLVLLINVPGVRLPAALVVVKGGAPATHKREGVLDAPLLKGQLEYAHRVAQRLIRAGVEAPELVVCEGPASKVTCLLDEVLSGVE